jgi:hypothetical protein
MEHPGSSSSLDDDFDASAAIASIDIGDLPQVQRIITCTVEGIVELEDLQALIADERPRTPDGASAGDITRIRERHHSVARLIASGMQQSLVASICGYTQPYLSLLLNNPSMEELIGFYRAQHINASEVITSRLRHVALDAVEDLATKLEAGELDPQELLGLAKLGLDRSGHGPQQKTLNVTEHHLLDHAELTRLNIAARLESRQDILPALPPPHPEGETQEGLPSRHPSPERSLDG